MRLLPRLTLTAKPARQVEGNSFASAATQMQKPRLVRGFFYFFRNMEKLRPALVGLHRVLIDALQVGTVQ